MTDTLTASLEPVDPPTLPAPAPPAEAGRRPKISMLPPAWHLLITAVLLFAAAIGFLVLIAVDPNGGNSHRHTAPSTKANTKANTADAGTLTLPTRINRYTSVVIPSADLKDQAKTAAQRLPAAQRAVIDRVIDDIAFGAYGTNGRIELSLAALKVSVLANLGAPPSTDPALIAQEILVGTPIRNARSYPGGSLGGALSCGSAKVGTTTINACSWGDAKTGGILLSRIPSVGGAQLAQLANVARAQIEK